MGAESVNRFESARQEQIYVIGNLVALYEATVLEADIIPEPSGRPLDQTVARQPDFVIAQFPPPYNSHAWHHIVSVRRPKTPGIVIPQGTMVIDAVLDFQSRALTGVWHCEYQTGYRPEGSMSIQRYLSKTVIHTMSRAIPTAKDQPTTNIPPEDRSRLKSNDAVSTSEAADLIRYLRERTTTGTETVTIPDVLPADFA